MGFDEIHLWHAALDLPEDQVGRLSAMLSEDEMNRSARFYFSAHRRRFIASHGVLRMLLGAYLNMPPARVAVGSADNGKPCLEETGNPHRIRFNLSHSRDMAFYGFCIDRRIGVDIECIRAMTDMPRIAERFFSPGEARKIAVAGEADREKLFFRYWTLKEAYLKATGEGIGGVRKIEIDEGPNGDFRVGGEAASGNRSWRIHPVGVQTGYMAAVAVESASDLHLILKRFSLSEYDRLLSNP